MWKFIGVLLSFYSLDALPQSSPSRLLVFDKETQLPVSGAMVTYLPMSKTFTATEQGVVPVPQGNVSAVVIRSVGYRQDTFSLEQIQQSGYHCMLRQSAAELKQVEVRSGNGLQLITAVDITKRPVKNAQELLRLVPGLFIGQHAGGGKAEQMFMRGFDLDHGTDIAISVDGIPVNKVSHAHGQGYADIHFLMPELVEKINYNKGAADPRAGNFATAGSVDFKTYDDVPGNMIRLETGLYNQHRAFGLMKLKAGKQPGTAAAYAAIEYSSGDGYFDAPQNLRRLNTSVRLKQSAGTNTLVFSASAFRSSWRASGQVPLREVNDGTIGYFGSVDPEGGNTSRLNMSATLLSAPAARTHFKNQLYITFYDFELRSNFTFFLVDSVNGDQVLQKESRHTIGTNSAFTRTCQIGSNTLKSEYGCSNRLDLVRDSELTYTAGGAKPGRGVMLGNIRELNSGWYTNHEFRLGRQWRITGAVRYDVLFTRYADKLRLKPFSTRGGVLSPKLQLRFTPDANFEIYAMAAKGFHSNDARTMAAGGAGTLLPSAHGADLGVNFKTSQKLFINLTAWYLQSAQEFVYVGDAGVVEAGDPSFRRGFEFSVRYQPVPGLYVDTDLTYAHSRTKSQGNKNYIPLAPGLTSAGGIHWKQATGYSTGIRYRYLADRPANEDYSAIAEGYFIADLVVQYECRRFQLMFAVTNVLNTKWKEAQFYSQSRLRNEAVPVYDIHFTPGSPTAANLAFTFSF